MSCGFKLPSVAGYFTLGYLPSVVPVANWWSPGFYASNNFFIQGSADGMYKIYEGSPGCVGALSQVTDGLGISAIKTGPMNNLNYAIAGAYSNGFYFSTISPNNASNVPIAWMLYPWPSPPTYNPAPSKPSILEDMNGDFFISGSFDADMYVVKVNSVGNIIWSSFYKHSNGLYPKDMMINPYNPMQLLIVGKTTDFTLDENAFMMTLDGNSGNVLNGFEYGVPGNNESFNTVIEGSYMAPTNPNGFVVGGYNQGNPSQTSGWLAKFDMALNPIWSNRISSTLDQAAGAIVDVVERQNTLGIYEYYSLTTSTVGMLVNKLNDKGQPFPNNAANPNNEYAYNIGGSANPSIPTALSYVNGSSSNTDVGLHVFGTVSNYTGWTSSHYVQAYFNGETNCYGTSTNSSGMNQPVPLTPQPIFPAKIGNINSCSNFSVALVWNNATLNMPCWGGTMLSGSNQRSIQGSMVGEEDVSGQTEGLKNGLKVFPNPVVDKTVISYEVESGSMVKIDLYDVLGQHIKVIKTERASISGNYETEIDFNTLNLREGVYFIQAYANGIAYKEKIIYSK